MSRPLRAALLGLLVVAVVAAAVLTTRALRGGSDDPDGGPGQAGGPTTWSSGVAGDGAASGAFARWRGSPVTIAATWNDSIEAQVNQWTIQPGAEYGDWDGDLDLAIGAIDKFGGESWAAAADGAYDDRWAAALQTIATAREGRDGTLFLRFAHEFNGEWEPWSVTGEEVDDFRAAWSRFRDLQLAALPDAQLVFCPTSETSAGLGLRWTDATPDPADVDVLAVDYYNQYPFVDDQQSFDDLLVAVDDQGAPRGLEAHRAHAEEQGAPFAVPEWNSNADMGDSTAFMGLVRRWFAAHAGTGPGQLRYEILFNLAGYGDGQFLLHPGGREPAAAAAYRELW